MLLLAVVAGMIGLSFASVPLYRLFCRATGWGGTTQRAAAAPKEIADAFVTVRFDAETAPDLGWEFRPLTHQIRVRPGEQHEVFFRATNRSSEPVTGTATYNVTPTKSGIYFDKLQCFCFTEQRLGPGESRDMGVRFFVDPELLNDPATRDVRHDHAVLHDVPQARLRRAGAARRRGRRRGGPTAAAITRRELSDTTDLADRT